MILKKIIKEKLLLTLFLALLSIVPVIWFLTNKGTIIDGLDTNFPLDPVVWFTRRLYIWNGTVNGGTDFGSSVSGLFFHFLQVVPYYLKFTIRQTELFTLIFWFTSIVISAYLFAKNIISKKVLVQATFVSLYCLNIYMFNTWENVKVSNLALVIGLPLVIVLIHKTIHREISYILAAVFSVLVGVVISGSGINPAYFLTIILGSLLFVISETLRDYKKTLNILLSTGIVFSIIFLVNIFWIVPLVSFLFINSRIDSLSSIGFTDWLGSLSEHTSIMNVLRLQGAWDWYITDGVGMPLYIPYALKYFNNIFFIAFSFVTPAIALISLFLKKKEKYSYYLFFSVLVTIGVFLGAGSHQPTGSVFIFLSKHVPFFSFFRSPWYIFTPLTILGLVSLVSLFFDFMLEKKLSINVFRGINKNLLIRGFLCLFIFGNIIYSYPLLTGKIYRPGRSDSFYVNFPDYVYKTKDWLTTANVNRILTYPDDQLESFNWGYKGTESILSLFSNKEVVTPAFNASNQSYSLLQQSLYSHLKRGEYESAFSEARMFSVDSLFTKTDVDTLANNINQDIGGYTTNLFSAGAWNIFKLNDKYISPKIYVASNIYLAKKPQEIIPYVSKAMSKGDVIVNEQDSVISTLKTLKFKHILEAGEDTARKNDYAFNIGEDSSYNLIFDNYSKGPISVVLDEKRISTQDIIIHDSYVQISNLNLKKGEHIVNIQNSENIDLFTDENLVTYKKIFTFGEVGQKIKIPVKNFDPKAKYELSFEYKYSYGYLPILKFTQYNGNTQYRISRVSLIDAHDWITSKELIDPVLVNSSFELSLENDPKVERPNLTEFRNLSLKKINPKKVFLVETGDSRITPPVTYTKNDPTSYSVNIETQPNPDSYLLVFNDTYDSGWSISGDGVGNRPVHLTVNGFSNAWYIPKNNSNLELSINYTPQKYYQLSFMVPLVTIILIVIGYIAIHKKR